MTKPRISVIIPSLNQDSYLERALCSVLDQGYRQAEIFVIDGGSTDSTPEILRRYESGLADWVSEPDAGPVEAINKGLAMATGQIITVLHADDLYLPGALDAVAEAMMDSETVTWTVGHCLRLGERDQLLGKWTATAPRSLAAYLMHDSGSLPWVSSAFRADVVKRHGPLDTTMKFAFDYEYFCRLLAQGERPTILPQALWAHREHDESRGATHTVEMGMEYIAASRRFGDMLPGPQRLALWRNCDLRERIYTMAQAEMQGPGARKFLWKRLLRRPWWLTSEMLRHALMHGPEQPVEPHAVRPAA